MYVYFPEVTTFINQFEQVIKHVIMMHLPMENRNGFNSLKIIRGKWNNCVIWNVGIIMWGAFIKVIG